MARIVSRDIKLSKTPIIFQFPDGRFFKKTLDFMYRFFWDTRYKKIEIRIYSNIQTIEKLGYEYIRIFVNFLQIYSNILLCERVQSFQQALLFGITQQPHQIKP